jgi:hypothetical protein
MNFNWSVLDDELKKNRGPEKLMPFLGARMTSAKQDAAMLIEKEFWADPSATSDTQPMTASYWLVPVNARQVYDYDTYGAATALTYGVQKWGNWNGGLPNNGQSGNAFTDVGGVDPGGVYTSASGFATSVYNRWRNWNFQWSGSGGQYTDIDGRNLGHAMDAMQWKPPAFLGGDLNATKLGMMRLCSCQVVKDSMEQFQRDSNDSVGMDLAKFQGATLFRSVPLTWIKALDTYSAYRGYFPIYGFNWSQGCVVAREGDFFNEKSFAPTAQQPDTTVTHTFLTYNILTPDRQKFGFVGSYVAGSAS